MSDVQRPAWTLAPILLVVAACSDVEVMTTASEPLSFDGCVAEARARLLVQSIDAQPLAEALRAACGGRTCDGPCTRCIDDLDCGDARLCQDGLCVACHSTDDCAAAGDGEALLRRNGCPVCERGPVSECIEDAGCAGRRCYRGSVCAEGCARPDCCANLCADAGCSDPAPVGCLMPCPVGVDAALCAAAACRCESGRWLCGAAAASTYRRCRYEP